MLPSLAHLFTAFVVGVSAAPTSSLVVHESRHLLDSTHGFPLRPVEADAIIPVRIGLAQANLDHGYAHLINISHPSSSRYGKHWTADEVEAYFAPSEASITTVTDWLVDSGISLAQIKGPDRGWLSFNIPAGQAERLFNTQYFEHETEDDTVRISTNEYHLPISVTEHVDYVRPGIASSPPMIKKSRKRNVPSSSLSRYIAQGMVLDSATQVSPHTIRLPADLRTCGTNMTPTCIRALYDVPKAFRNDSLNSLGIYENSLLDVYAQEDLDAFFAKYAPYVPSGSHPLLQSIDNATAPVSQNASINTGESDIDLDIAFSLLYPQTVTLYQSANIQPNGTTAQLLAEGYTPLTPFFDAIDGSFCSQLDRDSGFECGIYQSTRVISFSYEVSEFSITQSQAERACNEIMKLTLQGHTFVFSSGDYGVASNPRKMPGQPAITRANGCLARGLSQSVENGTVFSPNTPSNCPYVLSVGATQLNSNDTVLDAESAMQQPTLSEPAGVEFSSSGGFSNYFAVPEYQKNAVAEYFACHDPEYPSYTYNGSASSIGSNGGVYSRHGRGTPDVSANGANLMAYHRGHLKQFYGTSLSAPLFASLLTMINQERTAVGKGPIGFVNPVFYSHPEIFHDIVNGTHPGCGTEGFSAVKGWDPITGLGTPDYPKMLELFLSLP